MFEDPTKWKTVTVIVVILGFLAAPFTATAGPADDLVGTVDEVACAIDPVAEAVCASSGEQLWESQYNGPAGSTDRAQAVATSPDGELVFVTGSDNAPGTRTDYATMAYSAADGSLVWLARYDGPGSGTDQDFSEAIAVSGDGSFVVVTGWSQGSTGFDYATIAYDAETGDELWLSRYSMTGTSSDQAKDIVLSPDGSSVFVTGVSFHGGGQGYSTVAYDAATGVQQWAVNYQGAVAADGEALTISPDGATVFVTGWVFVGGLRAGTVAYDAATGAELWTSVYTGPGPADLGMALAVSPDGTVLYTAVASYGTGTGYDFLLLAYDSTSGDELWASTRYNGPGGFLDVPRAIAAGPSGQTVFLTGPSGGTAGTMDFATLAYNTDGGEILWSSRYTNGAGADATGLVVAPDGDWVAIAGRGDGNDGEWDAITLVYDAADGSTSWSARYDDENEPGEANALAVSPDGALLYVTGSQRGQPTGGGSSPWSYLTVAYQAEGGLGGLPL